MSRKVLKSGDSMTFHDDCSGKYRRYVIEFNESVDIRELMSTLFDGVGVEFSLQEYEPLIEKIYTERWVCANCGKDGMTIPAYCYGNSGDKDWQCGYCFRTSMRLKGAGRPIGRRHHFLDKELEFLKYMELSTEELKKFCRFKWREPPKRAQ